MPHKPRKHLLDINHPDWRKNRQELFDMVFPVNLALACAIWWWSNGVYMERKYYRVITMPIKEIPLLLASEDKAIQVLIEWRLKHG